MVRPYIAFCILVILQGALLSQRVHTPVIVTDHLPTPAVTCIAKDADGFMWVGTANGLSRYDGSTIRNFFHDPTNDQSLVHNSVYTLLFDPGHNVLLIGTGGGISLLNLENYQFNNPSLEEFHLPGELPEVGTMCFDYDNRFWFAIDDVGLAMYDWQADTVICYRMEFEVKSPMQLRNLKDILNIAPDPIDPNILWVSSAGLIRYDIAENQYVPYYFLDPDPETQAYNNQIRVVKPLKDSSVWLGTWSRGIMRFKPDRSALIPQFVAPHKIEKFKTWSPSPPFLQIDEDHVYLNSGETCVLNLRTGAISDCISMKNQLGKRYGVGLQYIDEAGRKWGVSEYGMHIFDKISEQITNYRFPAYDEFFYIEGKFIEVGPGQILITYQPCDGAYLFSEKTGLAKPILPTTDKYLTDNAFKGHDFLRRPNGEIWLLERHKMYRVDLGSNRLLPLDLPIDRLDNLWTTALQCRDGNIWLGSSASGLVHYDPDTRVIKTYREELETDDDGYSQWLEHLFEDKHNNIWIRKESGYSVYLTETDSFLNFNTLENKVYYLSNFIEDAEGNIWAGVSGLGLIKMHGDVPERGVMQIIGLNEGLKDDRIVSLSQDTSGHIWMITQGGLQEYDPVSLKSRLFGTRDGMITYDARFHRNPAVLSHLGLMSDGRMAYAPRAGFSIFSPAWMKTNTEIPLPYISRIKVADSIFALDLFSPFEDITFPYRYNNIEIECSAIGYSQSAGMRFEYKLGEMPWTAMDIRHVQFANLAPDDYVLLMRVLNSAGIPSEQLELHFKVSTPWWGAWWFYVICIFVLLVAGWQILRYREKNRERLRSKEHEIQVLMASLESRALRNQMNPHFLFNIFNNIQELILTRDTDRAYAYTTKFSKLLRTILDNARQDEVTIDQEREFLTLYLELESLRFDDVFDYSITIEEGLELSHIPVFIIQPLVENAIRHGLLPKQGDKELEISFTSNHDGIICTVRDNGIGMGKDPFAAFTKGRAHAMELIRKRLELLNNGVLKIDNLNGQGVLVEIKIPYS